MDKILESIYIRNWKSLNRWGIRASHLSQWPDKVLLGFFKHVQYQGPSMFLPSNMALKLPAPGQLGVAKGVMTQEIMVQQSEPQHTTRFRGLYISASWDEAEHGTNSHPSAGLLFD